MKNKKLEILIIAFISLKLFVFQWVNPEPVLSINGQGNSRTFGLTNYRDNIGNPGVGNVDVYGHKLFINTGDANFYMADITTSSSAPVPNTTSLITHNYGAGTFNAYAELTGIYKDKDDPPKRISPTGGVSVTTTQAPNTAELSSVVLNDATGMKFTPVRKIVPNDKYTLVLSVGHNRFNGFDAILVTYDNVAFEVDQLAMGNTPYYTLADAGPGTIKISKTTNTVTRSYPYHISLSFKTRQVPLGTLVKEFQATGIINTKDPIVETFNDPVTLRVVDSHDPNNKLFIPNYFTDLNGTVKVLINFQNEGDGATTNVVIEDELDQAILSSMSAADFIQIQSSLKLQAPAGRQVQPNFSYANGKIRVELCGLKLNGKKERNANGFFYPESSTMGSISYVLPKTLFSKIKPCHSVVNSAQIFFDCNPPIMTDLAYLTRIDANTLNLGLAKSAPNSKNNKGNNKDVGSSKKKISQDTTKQWPYIDVDSICPRPEVQCTNVITNQRELKKFNDASNICGLDPNGIKSYRWYPTSALQTWDSRSLVFKQGNRLLKQNFVLLASNGSFETVVHVPVDMCNMSLTYKWIKGKYTVSVVDPNMLPADQLVWNVACISCNGDSLTQAGAHLSTDGRTVTIVGPGEGDSRLISVYNPKTACSAMVEVPHHSSETAMTWWRWAQILMGIFLLVFLIWSATGKKSKEKGEK